MKDPACQSFPAPCLRAEKPEGALSDRKPLDRRPSANSTGGAGNRAAGGDGQDQEHNHAVPGRWGRARSPRRSGGGRVPGRLLNAYRTIQSRRAKKRLEPMHTRYPYLGHLAVPFDTSTGCEKLQTMSGVSAVWLSVTVNDPSRTRDKKNTDVVAFSYVCFLSLGISKYICWFSARFAARAQAGQTFLEALYYRTTT